MNVQIALITSSAAPAAIADAMPEHHKYMANIDRVGSILASGPLEPPTSDGPTGLIVFATPDPDTAKAIMDDEPLTRRGLRSYQLCGWSINEGTLRVVLPQAGQSATLPC